MKAIVLAAGRSTRTYPLTLTRPKPLIPLFNKPLLSYNLDAMAGLVEGFVLVVGYLADMVRDTFGHEYRGVPIEYAVQDEQKGTADALRSARGLVNGDFLVANGDDIYDAEDFVAVAARRGNAILAAKTRDPSRFGVLDTEKGSLVKIIEKPGPGRGHTVNAGLYRFTPEILGYTEKVKTSPRNELELVDAVNSLAASAKVNVVKSRGGFISVAEPADLLAVQTKLWPGVSRLVGPGSRVAPDAKVGPNVTVGRDCSVQNGAEVSDSVLFNNVEIASGAVVRRSVIGSSTTVDAGAVLEGAVLGDNIAVGPGARLREGTRVWPSARIPDGSVVDGVFGRTDPKTQKDEEP